MLDYDEEEDAIKPKEGIFNPDELKARSVNQAIHGIKYSKSINKHKWFQREKKYEQWLSKKSKRKNNGKVSV